jgi:hypothetical protein
MPAAAAAYSALLRLELDSIRLVSRSPKFFLPFVLGILFFICLFMVGFVYPGEEEADSICSPLEPGRKNWKFRPIIGLPHLIDSGS